MKREGYLMQQISDMDNLEWAFWKARRGKSEKKDVMDFEENTHQNLRNLQVELQTGTVKVGNYHFFEIHDPKKRQICAAAFTERVLHHAIMNVCHPNFERFQIYDSYATRVGKGTYAAIDRAAYFQKKYPYFLKIDCRKYFDSVDHDILKKQLYRRFKDERLLTLLYNIIDSYEISAGKGVPIGNLTSQYFANHYLAHADRFLTEKLKAPAMVRYMDDILIWHNASAEIQRIATQIEQFCKETLTLTFKHCYTNKTAHGVSFLGAKLYPTHVELNKKSKARLKYSYKNLLSAFDYGQFNESDYQNHLIPLFARPQKVKSHWFRSQMIWNIG